MELMNICMDCGNEWEQNNAAYCSKCGSGDFYTEKEFNYKDIKLEECIDYYKSKIISMCDADKKEIKLMEE